MTKGFDVAKIDSLEEIQRLKQAIRERERQLKPNKWVKMVDNQIVLTLRTIKRVMDEQQFEPNRIPIEEKLRKLSVDNYEEEANKQRPLLRGPKTKK